MFRGDFDIRYLIASGGMPSVHSAVVCALATVALAEGGLSNPLFGITGVIAAIVMYDSFGVRRSAGEQAKTLNRLIADLADGGDIRHPENYSHLREILGHRPIEVSIGAILGVVIALLFEADKLGSHLAFLVAAPTKPESLIFLALGIAMVGLAGAAFFLLKPKRVGQKYNKSYRAQFVTSCLSGGMILLFLTLGSYEAVSYLSARVLPYFVIIIWGVWLSAISTRFFDEAGAKRESSLASQRRERWLRKAGKTRKKT